MKDREEEGIALQRGGIKQNVTNKGFVHSPITGNTINNRHNPEHPSSFIEPLSFCWDDDGKTRRSPLAPLTR